MLVGERNTATRSIVRGFASSPLDDFLTTERSIGVPHHKISSIFVTRFNATKVSTSTLVRSIGSASQRQSSLNKTHSFLANYTRHLADGHQQFQLQFQRLHQPDAAGDARTAAHFPEPAGRRIVSCSAANKATALPVQRHVHFYSRQSHVLRRRRDSRVLSDLDLKVFQQGPHRTDRRLPVVRSQPRWTRRRQRSTVCRNPAQRIPERSLLLPDANNTYIRRVPPGRLESPSAVHSQSGFAI